MDFSQRDIRSHSGGLASLLLMTLLRELSLHQPSHLGSYLSQLARWGQRVFGRLRISPGTSALTLSLISSITFRLKNGQSETPPLCDRCNMRELSDCSCHFPSLAYPPVFVHSGSLALFSWRSRHRSFFRPSLSSSWAPFWGPSPRSSLGSAGILVRTGVPGSG